MDSFIKFASGLSTVENYAHDVYIKSNLSIELEKIINQIKNENHQNEINETPTMTLFCDIIEAILLHGLKEKFTTTVSNVFGMKKSRPKNLFYLDFWSIIMILSHNEQSKLLLKQLKQITTNVGRCRSWIRQSLNDCLLRSYLESLICDSSTLNSFYRSSAYLRDQQHTDIMKNLLTELDLFQFHLMADNHQLNNWSLKTLELVGVLIEQKEDSYMVATALDAIHLINDNNHATSKSPMKRKIHKSSNMMITKNRTMINLNIDDDGIKPPEQLSMSLPNEIIIKRFDSDTIDIPNRIIDDDNDERIDKSDKSDDCIDNDDDEISYHQNNNSGNSLNRSGWSTQPTVQQFDEINYNTLLESYSTRATTATVLSSTPDIGEIKNSILTNISTNDNEMIDNSKENENDNDNFEIISKNLIGNDNDDVEYKNFLKKLSKLCTEYGLDEQDYKCNNCQRPIGMIYGKCIKCFIDGHLYCIDCHGQDESVIPAQILFNWCFKKYPIAKHNKQRLSTIENEPIFDIKLLSPNIYQAIPEMEEILDLRTQLFFLHAYLFTCQEQIALKMRKLVWPREHLFEHIHLYSINDLQQVHNNILSTTLRQVILFARKHVANCNLCKLKGFYCEICKNSDILYPFDTDQTKRCDRCKSVFHRKCYVEKYDKNNCSKCLRLAKKRDQMIS